MYNVFNENPDEIMLYGNKKKTEPPRLSMYNRDEGLWVGQLSLKQLAELKEILIHLGFEKLPMSQEDINDFKSDQTSLTISFNNKQKTIYSYPLYQFCDQLLHYINCIIISEKLENISEGDQYYDYYKRLIR